MVTFARTELTKAGLLGNDEYDGDVGDRVLKLIEAFAETHTFNVVSDSLTVAIFNSLARGESINNKKPSVRQ